MLQILDYADLSDKQNILLIAKIDLVHGIFFLHRHRINTSAFVIASSIGGSEVFA